MRQREIDATAARSKRYGIPLEADRWPIVLGLLKLARAKKLDGVWLEGTRLGIRRTALDDIEPITWSEARALIESEQAKEAEQEKPHAISILQGSRKRDVYAGRRSREDGRARAVDSRGLGGSPADLHPAKLA